MIPTLALPFPLPRKPMDLQNLAPGTNPPFMTFDGEVKTDVNKIEEFLEEKLAPPRWVSPKPVLATRLSLFPVLRQFKALGAVCWFSEGVALTS